MKLVRAGETGAERPVVIADDDQAYDLAGLTADIDGAFLTADGLNRVRRALAEESLPRTDIAGQRLGAPIARPHAIFCIGMNYAAHAEESGATPPTVPVLFFKTPNTIAGPDDPVQLPRRSERTDWEVELGVVIGRRTSYLDSPDDAYAHIAGYLAANDLSERTFQLDESGGQFSKGKCCPGFSPLGPWLVPADEVDPGNLRLQSWVNGEPRQDSSTADMIFDVPTIVHHLSQYLVLEAGDLVLTGTPPGVALSGRFDYLRAGDVVEVAIGGLGRQRQEIRP